MLRYNSAAGSRPCSTSRSVVLVARHPCPSSSATVASRMAVSFTPCCSGEYDGLRYIATSRAKVHLSRAASHALAVWRSDGRSMSMMRATSTAASRRPSSTSALRNPRIRCTPWARASAAARRAPALRPYTPPLTHGGSVGAPPTARTTSPCRPTYTGDSSSTYGVTASTMSTPSARCRSVARYTAPQSSGRITVSTMLQNTAPAGTTARPSTSVCSDEGVRQAITLNGAPNRCPSSNRNTARKSARTAQVRLSQPSSASVSNSRKICGRPATSTSGFGASTSPPAARRDPSPPARINPCTLREHPFDLREAADARRGDEARGRGALRRRVELGQRVLEDASVRLGPAHHPGVADRRKQSRQTELVQTRLEIAREIRDNPEPVAPAEAFQDGDVASHRRDGVGVKALGDGAGVDAVGIRQGQPLHEQPDLGVDHGAEAERGDAA